MNRVAFNFFLLLFFLSFLSLAQVPNSWIDFSQSYYKIPVAKVGMYRLTYSDLQAAGFPVGSVDPRRIQIFHRGVEQAILVQGQADAVLNASDFLEFFGNGNDGNRDANLYHPSSLQPHSYYNIYSDTSAYFLTWNVTAQGKRMASFSEVNVSNIPKEIYHNQEKLKVAIDQYSGGYTENDVLQYTQFDQGEGWTGVALRQGQSVDYVLDGITNTVPGPDLPQAEVVLVGRDNISHSAEVYVGPNSSSLRLISAQNFQGYETIKLSANLNWNDIGANGKITVRVAAAGSGTQRFQLSASYIKLKFPQSFDVSGATEKIINLQANPFNKSYIELINPEPGLRIWDVTNSNIVAVIGTQSSLSKLSAVIPLTETPRKLYASINTITPSIKAVSFRQINPQDHDFLIVSNKALLKSAAGYNNVVKAYAAYRASPEGGGYDTLVVTVDQLYDQFNYGETSSLGIYEFVKFMVNNGSPRYLFLIGKARDVFSHRGVALSTSQLKDLVPTAGYPGSDMAFSAGLRGTTHEPALPTGRLSATKPEEVAAYLNKVKETESNGNNPQENVWRKEGLHLSGGIQPFELPYFKSIVDGFKSIGKGYYWGAKITTLAKREPNPVELVNVSDQINKGVNMVTFFGHSSPGTIDIDIGYVTDPALGYNNKGKYPIFLINGCNAGNSFSNGTSFGEDWMLAANKGARNFIAHSSFGFVNLLKTYSDYFYSIGFADSTFFDKGIGDVQKEVARRYLVSNGANMPVITQIQQMLLLGDPALKLFGTSKSDFETNDNSIYLESFDGNPVTALSDSFAVKVIVKNFGLVREKPLGVRLIRTFSNGTSTQYDYSVKSPFFQDTLSFKLFKGLVDASGNNEFAIVVDPENKIEEVSEANNNGKLQIAIPANGTKNLYPKPYSIESSSTVEFIFQDTDLLSASRDYQIEIDTVNSFNSPYLKSKKISGKVLARFSLDLLRNDSLVHYWRTKFASPKSGESKDWVTSSFTFINASPEGWSQSNRDQLTENKFANLTSDPVNGFSFTETVTDVFVRTFGSANATPSTSVSFKINNSEYNLSTQGQPCRNNTINLVAFNKTTTVPYPGIPFNFQDPRTCGREPQLINSFLLSEIETGGGNDLLAYIDNINVSDSVVIFSIGDPGYSLWSSQVQSKLGEFGLNPSDISSLSQGEPVIIFGRKGASPGTARIYTTPLVPEKEQELQVSETITGRQSQGKISSLTIGPAQSWKRFLVNVSNIGSTDSFSFSIFGVKLDGADSLVRKNSFDDLDLTELNALKYPYVRLELTTKDEVDLTPIQLKNWIVLYEPVAEGILLPKGEPVAKPIQEGAPWSDQFKFVNISNKNFSSPLTVGVELFNSSQLTNEVQKFSIEAPAKQDSTVFTVKVDTKGKLGVSSLNVFVNRKIVPEQYYDNNSILLKEYIEVKPDVSRPILDVSIDGRYIRNNDYVSSNPLILAVLKDENPFLFKTDTSGVNILLSLPCQTSTCGFTRINFSSSEIKWFRATPSSDFRVEYRPLALRDGAYVLRVEAADVSGNKSGEEPYQISFQVKSETTLTFNSVYPNPSPGNFYFQFQLTGNILPDFFSLRIFTTDGRLVQEFNPEDLIDFKIGLNELTWQATDLAGASMTNGMFIYRLKIRANEKEVNQQGKLIHIR